MTAQDTLNIGAGSHTEAWWREATKSGLRRWSGNCHGAAHMLVAANDATNHKLLGQRARARYGMWIGPIHAQSPFANRATLGMTHHGWVELADGQIADPTRWAFEHVEPYVYVGPSDYYDQGGDALREALHGDKPFPVDTCELGKCTHEQHRVELTPMFIEEVMCVDENDLLDFDGDELMGQPNATLTDEQLFWLCNLPIKRWKACFDSKAVARYLVRDGHSVYFPVDTLDALDVKG